MGVLGPVGRGIAAGRHVHVGRIGVDRRKLNFSNFVALPITFGISADYSINMLRRFQSEG